MHTLLILIFYYYYARNKTDTNRHTRAHTHNVYEKLDYIHSAAFADAFLLFFTSFVFSFCWFVLWIRYDGSIWYIIWYGMVWAYFTSMTCALYRYFFFLCFLVFIFLLRKLAAHHRIHLLLCPVHTIYVLNLYYMNA